MDQKSPFDAFKLCWDVIFQESEKCEYKFFNSEYCKILDSRDTNFEIVENRLAYTYKYGYFNILLFEKCFSLFINDCSGVLFPLENLKVCSLSNGPGFDIIGLLSALCISNKNLKCLPVFNAINIHESWSRLYKVLVCKAYETCIPKLFVECLHLNPININLIQGDVYSNLTFEAKNCFSNSNVLLMINVFVSSKASPTTFENSLKEIFTLLQPGSLIFFIGSKNNMKLFSKLTDMKQYVKCVYGPQKISLDNLPINEQVSNVIGTKPINSGHANFVVWQKKDTKFKSTEDEQKSLRRKDAVECNDEIDDTISELSSELSVTFLENHDEPVNDLKSSDKSDSTSEEINSDVTENISQNYEINPLGNIASNSVVEIPIKVHSSLSENGMSLMSDNKVLKEINKKNVVSLAHVEGNSASNKTDTVCLPDQITNSKTIMDQNTSNEKSKKKKKSKKKPKEQSSNATIKEDNFVQHKILQKSLLNKSCENSVKRENEITPQVINTKDLNPTNNTVQPLLQRCDRLISKVEELVDDIKNELKYSTKDQISSKSHFCNGLTENYQAFHHCCCVKVIHSCCCRKFCN